MHTTRTLAAAIAALCFIAGTANAVDRGTYIGWKVKQPARFVVSGVLRKDGTTDVIKPVHAIEVAASADAARETFERGIRSQYAGYTLIATVISPIPAVGICENSI